MQADMNSMQATTVNIIRGLCSLCSSNLEYQQLPHLMVIPSVIIFPSLIPHWIGSVVPLRSQLLWQPTAFRLYCSIFWIIFGFVLWVGFKCMPWGRLCSHWLVSSPEVGCSMGSHSTALQPTPTFFQRYMGSIQIYIVFILWFFCGWFHFSLRVALLK
jgi:hypothetical protein